LSPPDQKEVDGDEGQQTNDDRRLDVPVAPEGSTRVDAADVKDGEPEKTRHEMSFVARRCGM
jgi:hypothetical protein